tara:strand:- start:864 stop:2099 length:1236 start_codon:yes stop_codon:yes gene_type:complete
MTRLTQQRINKQRQQGTAGLDSSEVSGAFGTKLLYVETLDSLPMTDLSHGDKAFVNSSNRLYVSDASGWYNIALVNRVPTWDTEPDAAYTVEDSATPLTVIAKPLDSDNLNLLNQSIASDSAQYMVNISNDSSVWTFTPKTADSIGIEVANGNLTDSNGDFVYTFKWSDGINVLSKAATITYTPASLPPPAYNSGIWTAFNRFYDQGAYANQYSNVDMGDKTDVSKADANYNLNYSATYLSMSTTWSHSTVGSADMVRFRPSVDVWIAGVIWATNRNSGAQTKRMFAVKGGGDFNSSGDHLADPNGYDDTLNSPRVYGYSQAFMSYHNTHMYEQAFFVEANQWVNIIVQNNVANPSSHANGTFESSYDTNFTLNSNITWDVAQHDVTNAPQDNGSSTSNGPIFGLIYQLHS